MQHVKRYCKLIFTTLVVALCFCCAPLVAHADPLTGAMIGSMIGSGWTIGGFGTMLPGAVGDTLGGFFTDLIPWDMLVATGRAYITIRDLVGSDNVEVELSPYIAAAGEDRTSQFASHYNLQPGQIQQFGTTYFLGNYAFTLYTGNVDRYYVGPSIGTIVYDSTAPFNVLPYSSISIDTPITSSSNGFVYYHFPLHDSTIHNYNKAWVGRSVHFCYSPSNNAIGYRFYNAELTSYTGGYVVSPATAGITVASASPSVTAQSVVDPAGRANAIVLPATALEDIDYTDGEAIFTDEILQLILDIITQYAVDGEVVSSTYVDEPVDPPVPAEGSIAETQYTVLDETLQEFKEFFGDIYDGLIDFQESFGDWVDDVAAGWTEVFGDIYDTLVGWQEAFGDFADSISETVSDIADALADIVDSIKEGDFEFIDGFWKNFQAPFLPFFDTIKQHLGIWHYVVEWLGSISSAFTFFFGVMSDTGYNFVLPIYAAFAGTVVLAVYRRFGK